MRLCGCFFFLPLCPVWDLLVSDMPPSAWLLIVPGLQESRTSGTDVADGDRKHGAEQSPFKHDLMTTEFFSERGPEDRTTG